MGNYHMTTIKQNKFSISNIYTFKNKLILKTNAYKTKIINNALAIDLDTTHIMEKENSKSPSDLVASLVDDKKIAKYYNHESQNLDIRLQERVVQIRRVVKVVKGGKLLSFRAVVIVGNLKGHVGVGVATAKEVVVAVTKSVTDAKRNLITFPSNR